MLITITRTVINQVFKSTVSTEANGLEVDYFKAYGEPTVLSGGTLSFADPTRTSQTTVGAVAVLGVQADVPNSRTIVFVDPLLVNISQLRVGDSITFSGVTHEPLLNGAHLVVATDAIHGSIAVNVTGITTQNPFVRNVTEGILTWNPLSTLNQAVAGFTFSGTLDVDTVIHVPGLNMVGVNVGDAITLSGVTDAPALNGTHTVLAFNNSAKTITFLTPGGLTVAIPQFTANDPIGDLVAAPAAVTFAAPSANIYVRSGTPADFSVDGKTDTNAEQKTIVWARDLRDKIAAAVIALKTKPNPRQYPVLESTEV